MAKAGIGGIDNRFQGSVADLAVNEAPDDRKGHIRIGLPGEPGDLCVRKLGPLGRQIEPAIARKAGKHRV